MFDQVDVSAHERFSPFFSACRSAYVPISRPYVSTTSLKTASTLVPQVERSSNAITYVSEMFGTSELK